MTLGEVVRQYRKKKGWSVRVLSEESGVARQTITDAEHGRRCTSVAILIELLDAMGYELIVVEKQNGKQKKKRRTTETVIDKAL